MVKRMRIMAAGIEMIAQFLENKNPKTCKAILSSLPIEGVANRWGDEIYFEIPVSAGLEKAQQTVDEGDVAYWPPGRALCIFFGPTPASKGNKPRAASPVNVFAKIVGDPSVFRRVKDGDKVRIDKVD